MFGAERHEDLADALPVPPGGTVVDLGCGTGPTLTALAARPQGAGRLVGIDVAEPPLDPRLTGDPRVERVVADLDEPLPFADASVDAAVSHNVVECLRDPAALLREAARVLVPGGRLLLAHTDFDTLVFAASDVALTRRLVHHFCDTVQPWMAHADGTVGRRLAGLGARSPLAVERTFAWAGHTTTLEPGGPGDDALALVAADARRAEDLAPCVDAWLADQRARAARGEFLFSATDYGVLLRKPGNG